MKAVICRQFGPPDTLTIEEVPKPIPGDNEVLVEIRATCINWANLAMIRGKPFAAKLTGGGFFKPKYRIPGGDIAGRIEAVGRNVKQFKAGDEVYGDLGDCGFRGYAEYVAAPETNVALKPTNLSFEEAAAVPQTAVVALQGLRNKGQIKAGQKVLIAGASGGIGTFAVQIAKSFGAEVTGVCGPKGLELVSSFGADHVIDYTREDFARSGKHYDLILSTAGYRSLFDYRRALSPGGIYVSAGGTMAQVFQGMAGPLISLFGSRKLTFLAHKPSQQDLIFMKELIESGKVKPVIDRTYPFIDITKALRY